MIRSIAEMTSRSHRRRGRSLVSYPIFCLLAVLVVACAPLHLQGSASAVAPAICSTVNSSAPTPTVLTVYARGSPGEGMILPPPGRPMRDVATASVGDATLSVLVPDVPLLVGGAIGIELIARNVGRDSFAVRRLFVSVEDETGQDLMLRGFVPGMWPGSYPAPDDQQILAGQSLDLLENVQLPDAGDLKAHAFHLAAQMHVLSPSQPDPNGSGALLQTTSPPLAFVEPRAAQQLHAKLYPEKDGWCLQALAGDGSQPTSPLTAEFWAETTHASTGGPLLGGNQGVWVGTWLRPLGSGESIHVQMWVAGPEYVTALLDQTVPGY